MVERKTAKKAKVSAEGIEPTVVEECRRAVANLKATGQADPILIFGPTGAGKEHVAKFIHSLAFSSGDMASVNCAAFPRELIDAELFGYKQGAFTGAVADNPGLFGGDARTIFLDELHLLEPAQQAKLLRVIENRQYKPLGSIVFDELAEDKLIIAATVAETPDHPQRFDEESDQDWIVQAKAGQLWKDVASGTPTNEIRKDLLNRFPFKIPVAPLAPRLESKVQLSHHFLSQAKWSGPVEATVPLNLMSYAWGEGNIRELWAAIRYAVAEARRRGDTELRQKHLPYEVREFWCNETDMVSLLDKVYGKEVWELISEHKRELLPFQKPDPEHDEYGRELPYRPELYSVEDLRRTKFWVLAYVLYLSNQEPKRGNWIDAFEEELTTRSRKDNLPSDNCSAFDEALRNLATNRIPFDLPELPWRFAKAYIEHHYPSGRPQWRTLLNELRYRDEKTLRKHLNELS